MKQMHVIKKINRIVRDSRPNLPADQVCEIFKSGDLLEIGFLSKQCSRDLGGSCLMCDYGRTNNVRSVEQYIDEMHKILNENGKDVKYLLLCTNGSFFDEKQISMALFCAILQCAQDCDVPDIIIETHCNDVTDNKLKALTKILSKNVIIEMGFETSNQYYHDKLIMKGIDIKKCANTIELIHSYGIKTELNIMLGLPFLTFNEQIIDAKQAIEWAVTHNCDPVVFPINVKPHTLLWIAYENGFYTPISIWLLIKLLDALDGESLSRVIIAWYGNRDESYQNDVPTLLPQMCELCKPQIMSFCQSFLKTNDFNIRKKLLSQLIDNCPCNCLPNILEDASLDGNFDVNYQKFYDFLLYKYQQKPRVL